MVASWPANIPFVPERDSYNVNALAQAAIQTQFEDGPTRMRNASTAKWVPLSYTITMTPDEFDIFEAFYTGTISRGTARFYMKAGRPQRDPATWPNRLCYIEGGKASAKLLGVGYVQVSFTLNVLDW